MAGPEGSGKASSSGGKSSSKAGTGSSSKSKEELVLAGRRKLEEFRKKKAAEKASAAKKKQNAEGLAAATAAPAAPAAPPAAVIRTRVAEKTAPQPLPNLPFATISVKTSAEASQIDGVATTTGKEIHGFSPAVHQHFPTSNIDFAALEQARNDDEGAQGGPPVYEETDESTPDYQNLTAVLANANATVPADPSPQDAAIPLFPLAAIAPEVVGPFSSTNREKQALQAQGPVTALPLAPELRPQSTGTEEACTVADGVDYSTGKDAANEVVLERPLSDVFAADEGSEFAVSQEVAQEAVANPQSRGQEDVATAEDLVAISEQQDGPSEKVVSKTDVPAELGLAFPKVSSSLNADDQEAEAFLDGLANLNGEQTSSSDHMARRKLSFSLQASLPDPDLPPKNESPARNETPKAIAASDLKLESHLDSEMESSGAAFEVETASTGKEELEREEHTLGEDERLWEDEQGVVPSLEKEDSTESALADVDQKEGPSASISVADSKTNAAEFGLPTKTFQPFVPVPVPATKAPSQPRTSWWSRVTSKAGKVFPENSTLAVAHSTSTSTSPLAFSPDTPQAISLPLSEGLRPQSSKSMAEEDDQIVDTNPMPSHISPHALPEPEQALSPQAPPNSESLQLGEVSPLSTSGDSSTLNPESASPSLASSRQSNSPTIQPNPKETFLSGWTNGAAPSSQAGLSREEETPGLNSSTHLPPWPSSLPSTFKPVDPPHSNGKPSITLLPENLSSSEPQNSSSTPPLQHISTPSSLPPYATATSQHTHRPAEKIGFSDVRNMITQGNASPSPSPPSYESMRGREGTLSRPPLAPTSKPPAPFRAFSPLPPPPVKPAAVPTISFPSLPPAPLSQSGSLWGSSAFRPSNLPLPIPLKPDVNSRFATRETEGTENGRPSVSSLFSSKGNHASKGFPSAKDLFPSKDPFGPKGSMNRSSSLSSFESTNGRTNADKAEPRDGKLLLDAHASNSDFAALEQHIEDLTKDKFSLQRGLDAARTLSESLALENNSLMDDFNHQGEVVAQLKHDLDRLQSEIKAQQLVVASSRLERDRALDEKSSAVERSQALAAEVISLEEKMLRLRSQELKLQHAVERLTGETDSQKQRIASLEKEKLQLRSQMATLQEEKRTLLFRLRKAMVGGALQDVRGVRGRLTAGDVGLAHAATSTEDLEAENGAAEESLASATGAASQEPFLPARPRTGRESAGRSSGGEEDSGRGVGDGPNGEALEQTPESAEGPERVPAVLQDSSMGNGGLEDFRSAEQRSGTHEPGAEASGSAEPGTEAFPFVEQRLQSTEAEPREGQADGARGGAHEAASSHAAEQEKLPFGASPSMRRVAEAMAAAVAEASAAAASGSLGQLSAIGPLQEAITILPEEQQQTVASIDALLDELAEERKAMAKALEAEAAAVAELRAANVDLSRKLAVQTQRLELAVAQRMQASLGPSALSAVGSSLALDAGPPSPLPTVGSDGQALAEYVDEGDEVAERVLTWILRLFPGTRRSNSLNR